MSSNEGNRKALILVGGSWHNFEGFVASFRALFPDWTVEASYDLDVLLSLDSSSTGAGSSVDLVVGDTCFARYNDGREETGPFAMSNEQIEALGEWVRGGGAYLPYHSGTVLGDSSPEFGKLNGGVFTGHPPAYSFSVYPMFGDHPIREGVSVFSVYDEFYMERLVDHVDVHLVGIDRGVAYPLAWSKKEGRGRVAHVALGHSEHVWNHPMYQKLMRNTVAWLLGDV